MKNKQKHLEEKGLLDYDLKNDILSFKVKNKEYKKSIEAENIVIDLDEAGYIIGVQIFEASKFLNLEKKDLMKIPNCQLKASLNAKTIELRLTFQIKVSNKIIEKNPIIMQSVEESLPNSELICEASL